MAGFLNIYIEVDLGDARWYDSVEDADRDLSLYDLDRVLCGESAEAFVAAEGGGEAEKGQVVAGMAFVAG